VIHKNNVNLTMKFYAWASGHYTSDSTHLAWHFMIYFYIHIRHLQKWKGFRIYSPHFTLDEIVDRVACKSIKQATSGVPISAKLLKDQPFTAIQFGQINFTLHLIIWVAASAPNDASLQWQSSSVTQCTKL
jgi:hypothetical protein